MSERLCAVAIMAKASVAGTVKTRLVPPLSEEEAADAYLYLSLYRPYQWAALGPVAAASQHDVGPPEADPPPRVLNASFAPSSGPAKVTPNGGADMQFVTLLVVVGVLAILLLIGGFGFTVHECMRLSAEARNREWQGAAKGLDTTDNETDGPVEDRLVA